ncbi:MAG: lamin tail domain-containing protein, partial [Pirellulales bacterium]
GSLKITEIMYDPAGAEPTTEWIELVNTGTTVADLSGWYLDDEDKTNWGTVAAGVTLAPGEVAVIYNSFFGVITDTIFRDSWQVPAAAKLIGVSWGDLNNSPTSVAPPEVSNEVLVLRDRAATGRNTVDFAEDGTIWPAYSNGSSIYLQNIAADNAAGANWRSARVGVDGGIKPTGTVFSSADIGSPGWIVRNANPVLAVSNATVTGSIGGTITNTGTWSDADGDTVELSASTGSVTRNADGTWSWSLPGATETSGTTVTISAADGRRGAASVTFTYSATNAAPALGVTAAAVSGNVLQVLTNTGTWADAATDTVTLSASLGIVTKNADGTWSWSLTSATRLVDERVTITGTDQLGATSTVTFTVSARVAIANEQIFYKGSSFAGTSVDAALDPGKVLARPGATPLTLSYANLINSSRGINGLVLDVAGLANTNLTAADFSFRMSPQGAFDAAANPGNSGGPLFTAQWLGRRADPDGDRGHAGHGHDSGTGAAGMGRQRHRQPLAAGGGAGQRHDRPGCRRGVVRRPSRRGSQRPGEQWPVPGDGGRPVADRCPGRRRRRRGLDHRPGQGRQDQEHRRGGGERADRHPGIDGDHDPGGWFRSRHVLRHRGPHDDEERGNGRQRDRCRCRGPGARCPGHRFCRSGD